jgi:hypothetical protein
MGSDSSGSYARRLTGGCGGIAGDTGGEIDARPVNRWRGDEAGCETHSG